MLGLDWFQRLEAKARVHLKEILGEVDTLKTVVESTEKDLCDYGDLVNLEDLGARKQSLAQEVKDLERKIQKLGEHEVEVTSLERELKFLNQERSGWLRQSGEIIEDIESLEKEKEGLSIWESRWDELLGKKEQLDSLREADALMSDGSGEYARLTALAIGLENTTAEHSRVFNVLKTKEAALEILEEDIATLGSEEEDLKRKYRELQDLAPQLNSNLSVLEERYKELKKKVNLFESQSVCPTCGQHLDAGDAILSGMHEELEGIEKQIWDARAKKNENYSLANDVHDDLSKKELEVEDAKKTRGKLKEDIASQKQLLDSLSKELEQKKEAGEELERLTYDPKEHKEIKEELESMKDVEGDIAKMEAAIERLRIINERVAELKNRLDKTENNLQATEDKLVSVKSDLDQHETKEYLSNETKKAWDLVEAAKAELERVNEEISDGVAKNKQIVRLQKRAREAKSKLGLISDREKVARSLVAAVSKTGAPALIIESILPQIEKDANGYLASMSSNMRVLLESQKVTKGGNVSESLDIAVFSDGMSIPIESLSGGERFRADIALRLSIGKMLARRFGASVKMLAIDEGFGALDGDGQDSVLQVISSLTGAFDLILVISHVRSVAETIDMVGNTLVVSKGEVSRVEIK
jgi:exonuclease SbcC